MIAVSLYEVKYATPALLREKFIPWTSRDEQTPMGIIFWDIVVVIFMSHNNVTTCDGIENQQNRMPIYAIKSPLQ